MARIEPSPSDYRMAIALGMTIEKWVDISETWVQTMEDVMDETDHMTNGEYFAFVDRERKKYESAQS